MDAGLDLPAWLREVEQHFGGLYKTRRGKVSPHDPRGQSVAHRGTMRGGDRMGHHGYAEAYAGVLSGLLGRNDLTIVELGILGGSGLALWCHLFPTARVIGLDVDLDHFRSNEASLRARGAFQRNAPRVYEFDELAHGHLIGDILAGRQIDLMIDDALHDSASIMQAMREFMPYLAEGGVYIVEDNATVHHDIRRAYPGKRIESFGELTVIT